MKIQTLIRLSKPHFAVSALIAVAFSMLCIDGHSQVTDLVDEEGNDEKNKIYVAKMKDLPAPEIFEPLSSRYVGEADMAQYIIERAAVFSMRNRDTDPFLFEQDPSAKPAAKKIATGRASRRAALPPTPLSEVIRLINVTTIMPSEKKFLVGVREFQELDVFPLEFQGKTIQIKIVKVSARKIVFRDLEKKEEATLMIQILPPGMEAGGDKLQPPGMISPDSNLPLLLGPGGGRSNFNN